MAGHYLKRKKGQPWAEVQCQHCGKAPQYKTLGDFMAEECSVSHDSDKDILDAISGEEE